MKLFLLDHNNPGAIAIFLPEAKIVGIISLKSSETDLIFSLDAMKTLAEKENKTLNIVETYANKIGIYSGSPGEKYRLFWF